MYIFLPDCVLSRNKEVVEMVEETEYDDVVQCDHSREQTKPNSSGLKQ
jgi:hypothetical protein